MINYFAKHHLIQRPFWLGETSSAYGGGAHGLSNSFVAGFNWLDKGWYPIKLICYDHIFS